MLKAITVIIRLLLMAGFFYAIWLLVRFESLWHAPVAIALMLGTVPLNNWLIALGQNRKFGWEAFRTEFAGWLAFFIPILMGISVFLSAILIFRTGNLWLLIIFLYAGIPLFVTLQRIYNKEIPRTFRAAALAYSNLVIFILLEAMLVVGTVVFVIGIGAFGSVMLLITLFDLVWQLFDGQPGPLDPFFCEYYGYSNHYAFYSDQPNCLWILLGLLALHLFVVWVAMKYGERLFNRLADMVNSYR